MSPVAHCLLLDSSFVVHGRGGPVVLRLLLSYDSSLGRGPRAGQEKVARLLLLAARLLPPVSHVGV